MFSFFNLSMQWEPKPSRMMLLKMTDGQTEIQGMEYQPIAALGGNLQPGFKVIFTPNSLPHPCFQQSKPQQASSLQLFSSISQQYPSSPPPPTATTTLPLSKKDPPKRHLNLKDADVLLLFFSSFFPLFSLHWDLSNTTKTEYKNAHTKITKMLIQTFY